MAMFLATCLGIVAAQVCIGSLGPFFCMHIEHTHSTLAECDRTHASYVDIRFACHSQVTSQGTGAVNVRNADMAMY
jgi:hypothetical protein